MKHDDLKLKIDECINWYEDQEKFDEVISYIKAIKLVVELHKPIETYNINSLNKSWLTCNHCDDMYSCPTIQAVEKELQ